MLPITSDLLSSTRNRPFLRSPKLYAIRNFKGVVAHWTANTDKGAHAKANRNYFNNTDRFASAHYIVDDHSIIQCLRNNEVGYHVGGLRYLPDGERIRETANLTPNYFLIGFEMCVNKDGDWNKTYRNSAELAAYLLGKFRLTTNDLYRHYDITGKDCPKMMLEPKPWQDFKDLISSIMAEALPVQLYKGAVNANELNVRSGPGTQHPVQRVLPRNTRVGVYQQQGDWGLIAKGAWVNTKFLTPVFTTQRAVVTAAQGALVREGAAPVTKEIDALPKGAWIDLSDQNGDWYEHGPGRWINKADVNLVELRFGAVSGTTELNVRRGPNTTNPIVSRLKKDAPVEIIGEFDGWYQIGPFEWVFGKFITLQ